MRRFKSPALALVFTAVCAASFLFGRRATTLSGLREPLLNGARDIGVVMEPPSVDFGEQEWKSILQGEFLLVNNRKSTIVLDSVRGNCNCTVLAGFDGVTLAPGAALTIPFALDTQEGTGRKARMITATLDSGETISATLTVDVYGTYKISPIALEFGEVSLADPGEALATIRFASTKGRRVLEVRANRRWVACTIADRDDAQEILVCLLKEQVPPGWSTATLTLLTDDDKVPTKSVPLTVKGVHELVPTPSHVFLQGSGKKVAKFVTRTREPAQLVSADTNDSRIVATIVGAGTLELRNSSEDVLRNTVTVYVTDADGHRGRVLVSTF